jgi:TM2 domain/GYF domain 2
MTRYPTDPVPAYLGHDHANGDDNDQFYISRVGQEFGPYTLQNLRDLAASGQLKPDTLIRRAVGRGWFPAKDIPWVFSDKEWLIALVISGLLGVFGIDRFYLGYTGIGIAKLLTIGGLGIWALIDFVLIAVRRIPDADGRPLR